MLWTGDSWDGSCSARVRRRSRPVGKARSVCADLSCVLQRHAWGSVLHGPAAWTKLRAMQFLYPWACLFEPPFNSIFHFFDSQHSYQHLYSTIAINQGPCFCRSLDASSISPPTTTQPYPYFANLNQRPTGQPHHPKSNQTVNKRLSMLKSTSVRNDDTCHRSEFEPSAALEIPGQAV